MTNWHYYNEMGEKIVGEGTYRKVRGSLGIISGSTKEDTSPRNNWKVLRRSGISF